MARILVVEDRRSLREMIERLLGAEHTVDTAGDLAGARARLEAVAYALVLTDVRLPDGDGASLIEQGPALSPDAEVIVMTAFPTLEAAVAAVKAGAYDYLSKPFEPDDLLLKVQRALERRSLRTRARRAEEALRRLDATADLVGSCPPIRAVRDLIARVAHLDVTVLITGESGTGKEVAARGIHRAGDRADRPFVAVNCGAVPEALLESELFGHVRGAFTGATQSRDGLITEAADGTLFLDELGDLPLDLQVKLNRALEERRYRRVGESREREVHARVVAATHRDLRAAVAEGRFREDLFFRLSVYPIHLPPLRARGDDVVLLAQRFLERATERFGRPASRFSADALGRLVRYDWPGNVRELAHAVERAVILTDGNEIRSEHLPEPTRAVVGEADGPLADLSYRDALEIARERTTRTYLDALLRRYQGNVTRAAQHAGVERESLHRLIRKADLDARGYREP